MDEDRCFFESLLPHVKKMNPLKKLQFRTEVQQLVMTYPYNYSENKSAPVSDNYSDSSSQFSPTNLTAQNTSVFEDIW
uniref:BESS domain-containing protein n=1 Tax=Rhodnius prolixus TaxID=13249 RepID=T1HXN7_RHOPR